jgi:hypothetical protein
MVFYALCPFSEPIPEEIILALAQPASTYTSWYHGKKCKVFGLFLNILHTSVVCAVGTLTAEPIYPFENLIFLQFF